MNFWLHCCDGANCEFMNPAASCSRVFLPARSLSHVYSSSLFSASSENSLITYLRCNNTVCRPVMELEGGVALCDNGLLRWRKEELLLLRLLSLITLEALISPSTGIMGGIFRGLSGGGGKWFNGLSAPSSSSSSFSSSQWFWSIFYCLSQSFIKSRMASKVIWH